MKSLRGAKILLPGAVDDDEIGGGLTVGEEANGTSRRRDGVVGLGWGDSGCAVVRNLSEGKCACDEKNSGGEAIHTTS